MRRYFRLLDDVTVPKRWHLGAATLADGTEPRLRAGIPFESSEIPSVPVTHAGRVLDFTLTSFAVPIASSRLADAVATVVGADVQRVPVDIAGQLGMVVLNALRVLRCVDELHSEFIKWTKQDHRPDLAGKYRQITKLVLDGAKVPHDAHLFRIEGSLVELIVSEAVKDAMVHVGCLGAKFIELETSGTRSHA
ncbi:imm11 family protein [Sorangium sp. So ce1024]|uniref:imm11 family protein n=1 Tax=Sorangium sp. So ce1024 TaxID=3133327 RepID=UPI003F0E5C76